MASITITVPDAAVPFIREVLIADGWDQVTPPTLAAAVQQQVKEHYRDRITQLKAQEQQAQIQSAIQTSIATATTALGL